jgi:8-oxo-dGTP pyrophosphatase MutT (NUDIX family)
LSIVNTGCAHETLIERGDEIMTRKDYYHTTDAPKPNSIVPAASAVVVDAQGRILLHRRRDNDLWSLPGGAVEPGESITQTIIREVREETGLQVKVVRLIGVYTDPEHIIKYSDGEVRQQFSICFECVPELGSIQVSDESHEVCFFSVDDIQKINIHPAQVIRIKDYLSNRESAFIR